MAHVLANKDATRLFLQIADTPLGLQLNRECDRELADEMVKLDILARTKNDIHYFTTKKGDALIDNLVKAGKHKRGSASQL